MNKRKPKRVELRSNPKAVRDLLDQTLKAFRLTAKAAEYEAFQFWPDVVGPEIAKISMPEKLLRKRVLVVRVIDPVWVQELSLQKAEILDRMNALGVGAVIEDIRFVAGGPEGFKDGDR